MKLKQGELKIEQPARKWQHAEVRVPMPPGWEVNYTWGRYAPNADVWIDNYTDREHPALIVGVRRLKEKAVQVE